MGDASLYYYRVKIIYPLDLAAIDEWRRRMDDMRTWCYCNFGDDWGIDKDAFWFNSEEDATWFKLRWS